MFGEIDQLEVMKEKLNSVSPSFCLAKWMHVTMHLLNGHTHSCYLPNVHKIPLEEIAKDPSALHNTKYKKLQRKKMLTGERPSECAICWNIEDLKGNQISDRLYRGVDSWTMPFFDQIRKMPWDANVNPTYLEVSFSDKCNFKCSYCSPHVSSSWLAESKKYGAYELSTGSHQHLGYFKQNDLLGIPEGEPNPYIDAFWKWWPDLVKHLMFFRITGGEPLLSKHTFRVLEWLNENPQPQLELSINSNMGVPQQYLEKFFAAVRPLVDEGKVKNFMLHTSVDTFGAQAEYIRNGLKFEVFDQNIRRFLRELPKAQFAFMCTFNSLSIVSYQKFLNWLLELRREYNNPQRTVLLDIPHLMAPGFLSAKILPKPYQKLMEKHILFMRNRMDDNPKYLGFGIRPAEVDKMRRILEWMRSPNEKEWLTIARKDFYLFFSEHDRRRGTNFLAAFPEMEDFWQSCRALTEQSPYAWI